MGQQLQTSFQPPVTLVIPTLVYGGAERVMVSMANWWAKRGRDVTLITFDAKQGPFPLAAPVRRLALDDIKPLGKTNCPQWPEEEHNAARLRQALIMAESDLVISFLTRMNMRVLLAASGLDKQVIVSERNYIPRLHLDDRLLTLQRSLYRQARKVVVQTEYIRTRWALNFLPGEQVEVIANPLAHPEDLNLYANRPEAAAAPYLLAVGRLEEQKGFDLLLLAFARLAQRLPDIKLIIAGEGSCRAQLENMVVSLGLNNRVELPGNLSGIQAMMLKAAGFVLSSRFEGFPNVLMEALSLGLPCVAFDCPTGPSEMIFNGYNGLLVENENHEQLADALYELLTDSQLRTNLAINAQASVIRYLPHTIMSRWDDLINQAVC